MHKFSDLDILKLLFIRDNGRKSNLRIFGKYSRVLIYLDFYQLPWHADALPASLLSVPGQCSGGGSWRFVLVLFIFIALNNTIIFKIVFQVGIKINIKIVFSSKFFFQFLQLRQSFLMYLKNLVIGCSMTIVFLVLWYNLWY